MTNNQQGNVGRPPPARKTFWAWTIATVFGAGLGRPGPGTYGSITTVLLWGIYAWLARPTPLAMLYGLFLLIGFALVFGVPAATIVARESGREDPGHVVIDEVAGQLIALILCPPDWAHAILALILFRIFDILKPPPIRQFERLPTGTGIMLDDIAAGLFALAVFALIHLWF